MEQSDNIESQQHDIPVNNGTEEMLSAVDMGAGQIGPAGLMHAEGRSSHDAEPANEIGRDEEMVKD